MRSGIKILICSLIIFFTVSSCGGEVDFYTSNLHGSIIELKHHTKGDIDLVVKQSDSSDTLSFYLPLETYIEENNIRVLDSIAKLPNDPMVYFFRRKDGEYVQIAILEYRID